jgi:NTP pyrophosphatase (non-canonical NTP hydrolase)
MTLTEYIPLALRTEATRDSGPEHRMLHAAIGFATEAIELLNHTDKLNALEELGDLYWYAAIALDALEVQPDQLVITPPSTVAQMALLSQIVADSGDCLDAMKKVIFYNRPLDVARTKILVLIGKILGTAGCLSEQLDMTVEEVLSANIRKLKARYPEKFTSASALSRDLCNERAALS